MTYKEYIFTIGNGEQFQRDLLMNSLSEVGFDTFEESTNGFSAYIPADKDSKGDVDKLIGEYAGHLQIDYKVREIPHENWNEVWESNFEPLQVNERCYIRASFHEPRPEFEFEIVVDPKMAFGTGHHQTTAQMMQLMMEIDFRHKKVLDMGCGTGILAILASMMGAKRVTAIDYDPVCFDSTVENSQLNGIRNIEALCGSKEIIPDEKFDLILANINRNILLDQISRYAEALVPDGTILFSGFYEVPDLQFIKTEAALHQLIYESHQVLDNWVAARFKLLAES